MRAVAYIRVSSAEQIDGHSLGAQERLFYELCRARGWEPEGLYREEGKSAHVDSIQRRPRFRQLLDDASKGCFDVVMVHTLDRWSRNLRVMLKSLGVLAQHGVGLVSITENIDYSTPHGKMATQMLGSVAEFFSEALATHVRKGIDERAQKGFHLGSIPFGYASCYEKGQLRCESEHPGGVHLVLREVEAVKELFARYSSGTVTLSQLASWMNEQGFTTRNTKKLPDGKGDLTPGPSCSPLPRSGAFSTTPSTPGRSSTRTSCSRAPMNRWSPRMCSMLSRSLSEGTPAAPRLCNPDPNGSTFSRA